MKRPQSGKCVMWRRSVVHPEFCVVCGFSEATHVLEQNKVTPTGAIELQSPHGSTGWWVPVDQFYEGWRSD